MNIIFYSNDSSAKDVVTGLRDALPEFTVIDFQETENGENVFDPQLAQYAVVWNPPTNFFDGMTSLRGIFSLAAGVDHLLRHPALPKDVPLARLENAGMGEKIAEYVLYGVLHYQRSMDFYRAQQIAGQWATDKLDRHASNIHVGILGIGAIGRVVADRLVDNNYSVSGWSRQAKEIPNVKMFSGRNSLNAFVEAVDVLVCLLPLTDSTEGIIDSELLSRLGSNGYLINAARGKHVDTDALLQALQTGTTRGALLDVTEPEPLPSDHPLWQAPNVLITPHVAGPTQTGESIRQTAANIRRASRGEALSGLVGPEGY